MKLFSSTAITQRLSYRLNSYHPVTLLPSTQLYPDDLGVVHSFYPMTLLPSTQLLLMPLLSKAITSNFVVVHSYHPITLLPSIHLFSMTLLSSTPSIQLSYMTTALPRLPDEFVVGCTVITR